MILKTLHVVLNIDRFLGGRLVLENYGPDIEYIQGTKNIVTDELSILPIDGNQETTHESTYK